jgi:urease accessory protein
VRTSEQNWLRLSPLTAGDALELGYLAGNLHWRVRFHDGDLLVALDGPTAAYLARVDALIAAGKVRVL